MWVRLGDGVEQGSGVALGERGEMVIPHLLPALGRRAFELADEFAESGADTAPLAFKVSTHDQASQRPAIEGGALEVVRMDHWWCSERCLWLAPSGESEAEERG